MLSTLQSLDLILASIWSNLTITTTTRELPHNIAEFADVFPDELPGRPPARVVEFTIDLLPGTKLIFLPSYRLIPVELDKSR